MYLIYIYRYLHINAASGFQDIKFGLGHRFKPNLGSDFGTSSDLALCLGSVQLDSALHGSAQRSRVRFIQTG